MDAYLKCLYDHVMERLLTCGRPDMMEYRLCSADQDRAWNDLRNVLTAEQLRLLEDYQSAKARVCALEDQWLFQEAVALGKWMALDHFPV